LVSCSNAYNIPVICVVPDNASESKINAMSNFKNVKIIKISIEEWWEVMSTNKFKDESGIFISAFSNKHVIAGSGTIGIEILKKIPDIDVVLIPIGIKYNNY
jgi:threonine dehydratase